MGVSSRKCLCAYPVSREAREEGEQLRSGLLPGKRMGRQQDEQVGATYNLKLFA